MFVIPFSKTEFIVSVSNKGVEVTPEQYNALKNGTMQFNDSLTAIVVVRESELILRQKSTRIAELKGFLSSTDYQSHKHADGAMTEEEFAPIKAQRQAWRDEINALETDIQALKA